MITSPAYVVIKAVDEFKGNPMRINEQWQTVRKAVVYAILRTSRLKVGAGIIYPLSWIITDYSRYVISWKLCSTIKAKDVTDTLDLALDASGCADQTDMPRPLSDNDSSYVAEELADFLKRVPSKF